MSSTNHDVNLILKARDEATAKLNRLNGTIKKVALGIAGYFSARAITGFLKSSVAAFSESEQAARGLSDALQSIGEPGDLKSYDAFAKYMQKITTYEDDAILSSMKLGVTIGGLAGKDLEAATTAAIGLSKAFNLDLNAAMTLVGKAAAGNFGAFSRMGIVFREGMTDAEKYAEVLERGAAGFRIAQGETDTFRGVLEQLKNAWGDAKESLGQYIAESSRLKGVLQVTIFGLQNIGLVAKTAWETAKTAMEAYYDRQIERENKPGAVSRFMRGISSGIGTIGGHVYAMFASPEYRKYYEQKGLESGEGWGGFNELYKEYEYYKTNKIPGRTGPNSADQLAGLLEKMKTEWDRMQSGKFDFNAGAAVAGAGMGRTRTEVEKAMGAGKSGWSLFESRTAGGVHVQSPESRKLDRMIDLLAKIANQASRQERKEAYVRNGNPQLLLTNFR